jgi:hypothetical protein
LVQETDRLNLKLLKFWNKNPKKPAFISRFLSKPIFFLMFHSEKNSCKFKGLINKKNSLHGSVDSFKGRHGVPAFASGRPRKQQSVQREWRTLAWYVGLHFTLSGTLIFFMVTKETSVVGQRALTAHAHVTVFFFQI